MSEEYVRPEKANPEKCGITISNYRHHGCRCEPCRALKAEVHRKGKYGLAAEDYERMCEEQNFCCAICRQELPLCVDHDHATEEVRGLLCSTCNLGLGHLKDDTQLLYNAIDYLNGVKTY